MKALYWASTTLMSALMGLSAIPDIIYHPGAVEIFAHLGYPVYLLPFIGVAKILGVIAVLAPGFRRIKEWAYAGLAFDLIGAFYSHLSVGDGLGMLIMPLIGLALVFCSYFTYHKTIAGED